MRSSFGLAEKIRRCAFVVAISSYGRSQLYRLVESRALAESEVVHCGLEADFFSNICGRARHSNTPRLRWPPLRAKRTIAAG